MNNETKILLTINLEGGTLLKKRVATTVFETPRKLGKGKKGPGRKITYDILVPKEVTQTLKLTKDAYNYFVSAEGMPFRLTTKVGMKMWAKMTTNERVEEHLKDICSDLRGKSFTYQIVED